MTKEAKAIMHEKPSTKIIKNSPNIIVQIKLSLPRVHGSVRDHSACSALPDFACLLSKIKGK